MCSKGLRPHSLLLGQGATGPIEIRQQVGDQDHHCSERFAPLQQVGDLLVCVAVVCMAGFAALAVQGIGTAGPAAQAPASPAPATPAPPHQPPKRLSPPAPAAHQPPNSTPEPPDPPESPSLHGRWLGLDRLGVLQVLGGLVLGLIARFPPMTTSPLPAAPCSSSSNGASLSSLPRWRQFLSMLNWRRDPGYELRVMQYEQRKIQHELRM